MPLALALVWGARREWGRAIISLAVTALLFAPMLLFDLRHYVTDPGTGLLSLYAVSPVLWAAAALICLVATMWLATRSARYALVAAALMMFLGAAGVVLSYLAFLVVAVELGRHEPADEQAQG